MITNTHHLPRFATRPRTAGITLVELLVVLAVGSVVLTGAIAMLVSHLRTSSQLTALLRLQDICGRVQFLINTEIQQAERASGGMQGKLILDIPDMEEAPQITYELNTNQELRRTGPLINDLGRLDDTLVSDELVVRGVQAFNVDTSNPRHPTYSLTVRDANGVTYAAANQGGAQCRVREINSGGS